MTFREQLKYARNTLGLSRREIAKRLGINSSTVSRLERGIFQPRQSTIQKMNELVEQFKPTAEQSVSSSLPSTFTNDISNDLSIIIEEAKTNAIRSVNVALVQRNWLIGKRIDEEILTTRAEDYGKEIISNLSKFLTEKYGKGFDSSTLYSFVRFSQNFPNILETVSPKSFLSWSHYRYLLSVTSDEARAYYEEEALACGWSVRELRRAIYSQYYERLLSTGKKPPRRINVEPEKPHNPEEYIKSPIIAEFLGLPDSGKINESVLEQAIIDHLTQFLLELGKGYCFVERQQRIPTDGGNYYVDLVFYNRILRCFVLIDLKTDEIDQRDVGQMDMYVRMYDKLIKLPDENPTLGIILCSETNEDVARYSMLSGNEQLFASKYKLYLPNEEDLRKEIEIQKTIFESSRKDGK